jgi:hypothetical protein
LAKNILYLRTYKHVEGSTMRAKGFSKVKEAFQPTEEDDHSVVVILYDKFKAFSDEDYITAPHKYESLEDMPPLPEDKAGYEHTILHQDGRTWEYRHLQESDDPPDWFPEDKR